MEKQKGIIAWVSVLNQHLFSSLITEKINKFTSRNYVIIIHDVIQAINQHILRMSPTSVSCLTSYAFSSLVSSNHNDYND